MIVIKNISKKFILRKKKKWFLSRKYEYKSALTDLSLEIPKGSIVGLLGVNGAGKSTLIKILTTLLSPSSGTYSIDGIDALKNYKIAKEKINLIAGGERSIYWRLTARENLEYFGSLYGLKKDELEHAIKESLVVAELDTVADIPVEQYSKGMKQRLQIARGIINDPEYLFLDEPTLGLDILIAKEFRKYIKKLSKENGKGILLTTHYILEAEELCDYIYIIHEGRLVVEGTPEQIKEMYSKKYFYRLTFEELLLKDIKNISSEITIEEQLGENVLRISSEKRDIKDIIYVLSKSKGKVISVEKETVSLEDVILDIISCQK